MTDNKDKLLDHDYDGIKELDNDLPRWWLGLFYFSIVWAVLYMMYYHVTGLGYSQEEEYLSEMNPNYVRVEPANAKLLGLLPEYHIPNYKPGGDFTPRKALLGEDLEPYVEMTRESDTTAYVALTDQASLATGQDLFVKNCASCHGNLGEGGVGPNLTDQYWLHGSDITDVVKSVGYGYPTKGMIAWRGMLKPEQILLVASHVVTLRGTNPPNQKAPQGELVTE